MDWGKRGGDCTIRRTVDEDDRRRTFREEWAVMRREVEWPALLIAERNMAVRWRARGQMQRQCQLGDGWSAHANWGGEDCTKTENEMMRRVRGNGCEVWMFGKAKRKENTDSVHYHFGRWLVWIRMQGRQQSRSEGRVSRSFAICFGGRERRGGY